MVEPDLIVGCPKCGQVLSIPAKYAGQKGRCNKCGAEISVPYVAPEPPVFANTQPPVIKQSGGVLRNSIIYGFGGCLGVGIAICVAFTILTSLSTAAKPRKEKAVAENGISLTEFNAISTGMDVGTVNKIIGGPGELKSDSTFGAGTQFASTHAIYSWQAESGFGNASVSFTDWHVSSKSQFGLK